MPTEKNRALVTNQFGWQSMGTITKAAVDAGGGETALGILERLYSTASILDTSIVCEPDSQLNGLEVRFLSRTDGFTFDIDIWARRKNDNNLTRVCTLDVVIGNQTGRFADTINVSNADGWPKKPKSFVSGTNHIARILFDFCGYSEILFHGYATFGGDITIEVSGY